MFLSVSYSNTRRLLSPITIVLRFSSVTAVSLPVIEAKVREVPTFRSEGVWKVSYKAQVLNVGQEVKVSRDKQILHI